MIYNVISNPFVAIHVIACPNISLDYIPWQNVFLCRKRYVVGKQSVGLTPESQVWILTLAYCYTKATKAHGLILGRLSCGSYTLLFTFPDLDRELCHNHNHIIGIFHASVATSRYCIPRVVNVNEISC